MDEIQGKKNSFQLFIDKVKCTMFDAVATLFKNRKIGNVNT
jgi:hypothetical protein